MGFDAPTGVGHAMRDRLGLGVAANGAAYLMMIDNATRVPVRIRTEPDANGIGYLEFLDWSEDLAKPGLRGFQRARQRVRARRGGRGGRLKPDSVRGCVSRVPRHRGRSRVPVAFALPGRKASGKRETPDP